MTEFDFMAYARTVSRHEQLESTFAARSVETGKELDRLVIEQRCKAYILDKAKEIGCSLEAVKVETRDYDQVWMPAGVMLTGKVDDTARQKLSDYISSELGIAPEKQQWSLYG